MSDAGCEDKRGKDGFLFNINSLDLNRSPEEEFEDKWKEHSISKYVPMENFRCLSRQQYKPYTHCIEKYPEDSLPSLFLGIQVQRWVK